MTDLPAEPEPSDDGPSRHRKPAWYVRFGPVGWSVAFAAASALVMLVVLVLMAIPRGRLGCGGRTAPAPGGSASPSGSEPGSAPTDSSGTGAALPCDDACDDACNDLANDTCDSLIGCGGSGGSGDPGDDATDTAPTGGGSTGGGTDGGGTDGGGADGGGSDGGGGSGGGCDSGSGGSGGGCGSGGSGGDCGGSGGDCSGYLVPPGHPQYGELLTVLPTLVSSRATPTPAARLGVAGIRAYQRWVSPRLAVRCRYTPTCSQYGLQAIQRYGLAIGVQLAYARVRRCTHRVPYGTPDRVPAGG